ncbi:hypothetical protein [Wocania ichthyoenteri]|uniref:hypothetical protein n=1 Tax=Wocania ichthyoenteri TaxID=1230531 RepID=UPI00053EF2EE|nr:hypothetical protein [Wocania ichthyoenteri]
MRKLFFTLLTFSFVCLSSCSDGDIIDVELDFEGNYSACQGVKGLVLYKTKSDPSESLSVIITSLTIDDLLAVGDDNTFTTAKTGTLNYRTYSNTKITGTDLFCKDIPSSDINIINDYDSSCEAVINTTLTEDDNDGVPAALEDVNGDDNLENDDTDGDGLPNYIDEDDDGDNVPTKDEDLNKDGDFTNDDTDGDGVPNYLDKDDDGDGIDTRDEETNTQDQNPINDVTNNDIGADYLNKDVANTDTPPATVYRKHTISQTYIVILNLKGIDIEILSQDELDFGELSNSKTKGTRTVTPAFN